MEKQEYLNGVDSWCDLCKRVAVAATEGESAFYDVMKAYFVPKCDDEHGMALWSEKIDCYVFLPLAWWRHALGLDDKKKFSDAEVITESYLRFMSEPVRFSSAILWISHVELVKGIFETATGHVYEFYETQE